MSLRPAVDDQRVEQLRLASPRCLLRDLLLAASAGHSSVRFAEQAAQVLDRDSGLALSGSEPSRMRRPSTAIAAARRRRSASCRTPRCSGSATLYSVSRACGPDRSVIVEVADEAHSPGALACAQAGATPLLHARENRRCTSDSLSFSGIEVDPLVGAGLHAEAVAACSFFSLIRTTAVLCRASGNRFAWDTQRGRRARCSGCRCAGDRSSRSWGILRRPRSSSQLTPHFGSPCFPGAGCRWTSFPFTALEDLRRD